MRPQLRAHLPAATRLFDMAADGAFHDIRAISLVGPPGCCKRRIATMLAEELSMAPVPIVLTSRADTAETRTASCAVVQLMAHRKREALKA